MTTSAILESFTTHDAGPFEPVRGKVVATWPEGTFVENLAIDTAGKVYVTLYTSDRIDRYDPATGLVTPFAELPGSPMGVEFDADGVLWVTGGLMREGPAYVWKVTPDGQVRQWALIPDATFINGCTMHPDGKTLLICESQTGRILAIDLAKPDHWWAWLTDDHLKPDHPQFPGANGIKIADGWAWITVSGRHAVVRAPLMADGAAGPLEVAAGNILGDDFAIGASGDLYITTHPMQSVVRLKPSGERTTIAGPEEGAVGSTACLFGRAPGDENALYVTTEGGMVLPHNGVLQKSKLLRIEVGEGGRF